MRAVVFRERNNTAEAESKKKNQRDQMEKEREGGRVMQMAFDVNDK